MGTRREFISQAAALTVAAATVHPAASMDAPVPVATKGRMKTYKIPHTDLEVSRLAAGVEMLGGEWDNTPLNAELRARADRVVKTAYENGFTLFDTANIYGRGKSEQVFGEILRRSPGLRDNITIQTKCGIILPNSLDAIGPNDPLIYDSSYDSIVGSVEGSLKRLSTDRIDILLLHRPDPLIEPQELARAFDDLHRSGKVRYFGVSNHNAARIDLLKKYVRQPIVVNQIQVGLMHPYVITEAVDFNLADKQRRIRPEFADASGILDYCQQNEIVVEAWSPVGALSSDAPTAKPTLDLLTKMGAEKGVPAYAVALAWLLRHPAGILPITGSTEPKHLIENSQADKVSLSRKEWFGLLHMAAGHGMH